MIYIDCKPKVIKYANEKLFLHESFVKFDSGSHNNSFGELYKSSP